MKAGKKEKGTLLKNSETFTGIPKIKYESCFAIWAYMGPLLQGRLHGLPHKYIG